jgi:4-amino-4-deoxy-L-arabinose transferase-like glycosyltransferase
MFTLLTLCLAVQAVNIMLSDGAWLGSWGHRIGFALALAMCSIVRHNGFFFTLPIAVLLFVFFAKKHMWECLVSVILAALVIFGVKGPLYRFVHVTKDDNQGYVEAVGIPMTILGSIYITQPEALDQATTEFLLTIATPEEWQIYMGFGSYNSIKWVVDANEDVAKLPPADLLRMTWRACRSAPRAALQSVLYATQFVWDPNVYDYGVDFARTGDYAETATHTITGEAAAADQEMLYGFDRLYGNYKSLTYMMMPSKALQSVGIAMTTLALALFWSLRRGRGLQALLLALPSAAYNLGTMLLLCGPEYRFFQFNAAITLPLVLVLLGKPQFVKNHK